MRTWTLEAPGLSSYAAVARPGHRPDPGERVEVVELRPVLDLLERLLGPMPVTSWPGGAEAEALLRTHGRLVIHGPVAVIELGPVLSLLERLKDALEMAPWSELGREPERDVVLQDARTLLTAHGRLDG